MGLVLKAKVQTLGTDAIFQYSGTLTRFLAGLIFYIVVDRLFDTTLVGAIALLIALIGMFDAVFSIGLGAAAQHFISAHLGKEDFGSARRTVLRIMTLAVISSFAGALALEALSPQISDILFHSPDFVFFVRVAAIILIGTILFEVFNGLLLGLQNFRASGVITVITWISYYAVAAILAFEVRSLFEVVLGWMAGMFTGMVIELVLIARAIRVFPSGGTLPDNHVFFGFLVPVLVSGLLGYTSTYSDRFIVAGLLPLSQLGIYNFVLLFASSMMLVAVPFRNILIPKFSELFGRGEKDMIRGYVRGSVLLFSFIYIPMSLGIAAIAPLLLDVLGGAPYANGATSLVVIMFFSAVFSPQYVLTQAVVSVRKTYVLLFSTSVPLACNIALSIILIPRIGLVGAALGFSSVNVAAFFILLYYSRKEKLASFGLTGLVKIWAASLITFLLIYSVRIFTGNQVILIPLYIAVGLLVYVVSIRLLRTFSGENRNIVSSLFPAHNPIYRILSVFLNVR